MDSPFWDQKPNLCREMPHPLADEAHFTAAPSINGHRPFGFTQVIFRNGIEPRALRSRSRSRVPARSRGKEFAVPSPGVRAVVQRVAQASVSVDGEVVGEVGRGLLVLVGVAPGDKPADAEALADKLVGLRVFPDDEGKMNRSVADVDGEILAVSQFTLLGDVRKGRRPSFVGAAPPEVAEPLVEALIESVAARGVACQGGRFGALMSVSLTNDGPVTLVLDVVDGRVG